jgi:uncharacterized protein Smg (DUF494 family)
MFEVLVYMFENYVEANVQPDHNTLAQELFEAGFDSSDISPSDGIGFCFNQTVGSDKSRYI